MTDRTTKKTAAATPAASVKKSDPATDRPAPEKSEAVADRMTQTEETPTMDTNSKTFTDTAKDMAGNMQTRMQGAYEKGTEMTGEMVAFQKANAEAMIESGKIYFAGLQDMGRMLADDGKKAGEQMVEDAKDMAKVTTPTELVQLQNDIARRNFDAAIAFGSKATEHWMKLANESFAPLSSRMSVAAEKVATAA